MAGFTDGFTSTLNLMLSARRVGLYEEELENRREKEERSAQPIDEVAPDTAANLGVEPGTSIDQSTAVASIDASVAAREASEATTEQRNVQTQLIQKQLDVFDKREAADMAINEAQLEGLNLDNISREQKNLEFGRQIEDKATYRNAVIAKGIYADMQEIADNPDLKGTPTYDYLIQTIVSATQSAVDRGDIDIAATFSPEIVEAINNLKPLTNGFKTGAITDVSEINLGDYNESLNRIFGTKKNKYLGKKYIANDGTSGVITDVNLDFNTFEIEPGSERSGGKAILKAVYSYRTEDGEIKQSNASFIPDAKKAVIRETQKGTDAFSVSLTDMIDITSATEAIVMDGLNRNPSIFQVAADVNQRRINALERTPDGALSLNVRVSEVMRSNLNNAADVISRNQLDREYKYIGGDNAKKESDALTTISAYFPKIMSDVDIIVGGTPEAEEAGITGEGRFLRLKRNEKDEIIKPIQTVILDTLDSEAEVERRLKQGTPFEDVDVDFDNNTFDFGNGAVIPRTVPRDIYFDLILKARPDLTIEDLQGFVDDANRLYAEQMASKGVTNPQKLTDGNILELLHRTYGR